jgi:hypothetical protein
MSQSAKGTASQEVFASARRNRAGAAGADAFGHAANAMARAGFTDASLVLRWPAIVGAEVARIAVPVKLQEGMDGAVLTLRCDPGAAVFLQHQTRPIVDRVNAYLGGRRVARIRLVAGAVASAPEPSPHPLRSKAIARDGEASANLGNALNRLARLRASLRK